MIAVSKNKRSQVLFLDGSGDRPPDTYIQVEMELEEPLVVGMKPALEVSLSPPLETVGESSITTELESPLSIKKECD